jgi:AcrR family transcriptional regulator
MPKTQQQFEEIRNEKKQLLKDVALQLFAEQGYTRTSISEIAKKANVSKGLMYNYFQSKEELMVFILNSLMEDFSRFIDPNRDNIITEEEALNFIDIIFDLLKNKRESLQHYFQLIFQPEVMQLINKSGVIRKDILEQIYLLLDFFIQKQTKTDPEIAKVNILSLSEGFLMRYVYFPNQFSDVFMKKYKTYLKKLIVNSE